MSFKNDDLTRRSFLQRAGQTLAIAGAVGAVEEALSTDLFGQQLQVPEPLGKKIGFAIVGLGRLSINQILPAFAKCEKSKLVPFVTGDRAKGEKLAARTASIRRTFTTINPTMRCRITQRWMLFTLCFRMECTPNYRPRSQSSQARIVRKAHGQCSHLTI